MAGHNPGQGHGRGCGDGWGSGRGGGCAYNKSSKTTKVGLCKELEGNIFHYGSKMSADLMQTTQEKIVQYMVAKYGGDITNKLQNWLPIVINPPEYSPHIKARHVARVPNKTTCWQFIKPGRQQ